MTLVNIDAQHTVDLGLSEAAIQSAEKILSTLLADEYMLYTKLRKYHWNVTGPQFHALHEMFEEQYNAIEAKIDETAERMRAYGLYSPGTMVQFIEDARLEEYPDQNPDAQTMLQNITADHETMVRNLREDVEEADDTDDVGLEDFLTAYLQDHQDMAWMMRSFLANNAY